MARKNRHKKALSSSTSPRPKKHDGDRTILMLVVAFKIAISCFDVSSKWDLYLEKSEEADQLEENALSVKEQVLDAEAEFKRNFSELCLEAAEIADFRDPSKERSCTLRMPKLTKMLLELRSIREEGERELREEVPRMRREAGGRWGQAAAEAGNAAERSCLLLALFLMGSKERSRTLLLRFFIRASLTLSFLTPVLRFLYSLGGESLFYDEGYSQENMIPGPPLPLLQLMADLILFLPVADHRADELFLERLQGVSGFESPWTNFAADVAFFTAHIFYYSALKSVFQYFLWLDRNKGGIEEAEEKEEPLKPLIEVMGKVSFPRQNESLLHACIYGHHSSARAILRRGKVDISGDAESKCLHLAVVRRDVPLVKIILGQARKNGIDAEVIGAANSDGLNCAEAAASSGHVALAACFFKNHGRSNSCCSPERALSLAVEGHNFETASAMAKWLGKDEADTLDLIERCRALERLEGDEEALKFLAANKEKLLQKIKNNVERNHREERKQDRGKEQFGSEDKSDSLASALEDFFECPVCMEDMGDSSVVRIFACSNDHWLCSKCRGHISACPICREDFKASPPRRCLTAEKLASNLAKARK